jgi:hypothetical protein
MIRVGRCLKMLKRAGRGHDPDGVSATKAGECAVLCPACPHPGKNLPDDWDLVPENQRYVFDSFQPSLQLTLSDLSWLYGLFLGIDANFRLKRKMVSSDDFDPGLGCGYAYFVEEKPYKEYLAPRMDTPQEVRAPPFLMANYSLQP